MDNQIERITLEFFKNLKCNISKEGEVYVVGGVPRSFEDIFGKPSPYKLCFLKQVAGAEYVIRGSALLMAMTKYLEGASKTTLLRIDFNVDPMTEIARAVSWKNCEIGKISRKDSNNFFARFTFLTTFRYLSESEQAVSEIYVHNGKVVKGDLSGYKVIEGDSKSASGVHIEKEYSIARDYLKGLLKEKTSEIGATLGKKLETEIKRIEFHYDNLLGELGGDINTQLKKIREVESQLRVAEGEEAENLRVRLDKLRKGLLKVGDDEAKDRVLKEQEFTIKDAQHKHSLNIDNKLINTTIIYYPVYSCNLFLRGGKAGRNVEVVYDPLTKEIGKISCDSCGKEISRLNLCSSGHICCDNCLGRCSECGAEMCDKCLKRNCNVCGKILCKNCTVMCMGCGKHVCRTHFRKDSVTGEERCVNCLRACFRCHNLSDPRYFGVALDGSKVCQKCLGEERRNRAMKRVFEKE
jgi:hypothetical protein